MRPAGGTVLINGIHEIDGLRMLCGKIESVQAQTANGVGDLPVENTAAAVLRLADGALGTLIVSDTVSTPWTWEWTSYENPFYPHESQSACLVTSTRGALAIPSLELWWHEPGQHWGDPLTRRRVPHTPGDAYVAQMRNFAASIRADAAPVAQRSRGCAHARRHARHHGIGQDGPARAPRRASGAALGSGHAVGDVMTNSKPAACVMGWPVEHSRSPLIHGYWLKEHGIEGDYRREPVRPEDYPQFLATLAERGYVGGNVTMPLKDLALELSEPDERARAVGAANTLWLNDGRLRSTNTDVEGFVGSLDASAPGWDHGPEKAVVIGAGGAARAVVYGLIERGVPRIHVVNRTLAKAEALRERFGPAVHPTSWDDLPRALQGAGLVANATSLGLKGNLDGGWDLSPMREDAVGAEVNYVPLETALLRTARARGMRTSDGLGMLLYQAGRGFELWFGVRPQVTPELRALVERELVGK